MEVPGCPITPERTKNGTSPLLMYAVSASVIGPAVANTAAPMRESRTSSADSASRRAKLAPAAEIAEETSAQRADALQVGRGLPSGREGTMANDDHLRVPPASSLTGLATSFTSAWKSLPSMPVWKCANQSSPQWSVPAAPSCRSRYLYQHCMADSAADGPLWEKLESARVFSRVGR